jgi:hypothetical protein
MNFNISCIFLFLAFFIQNGMQGILNRNIKIGNPKYGGKIEESKIVLNNVSYVFNCQHLVDFFFLDSKMSWCSGSCGPRCLKWKDFMT